VKDNIYVWLKEQINRQEMEVEKLFDEFSYANDEYNRIQNEADEAYKECESAGESLRTAAILLKDLQSFI